MFGSVTRGEEGPHSDLDFLVQFPEGLGLLGWGRVRAELEALLGCSIDLVPEAYLKPKVRPLVEADLVRL